jgi:DNA-binding ferritin-like protein (Dps family)
LGHKPKETTTMDDRLDQLTKLYQKVVDEWYTYCAINGITKEQYKILQQMVDSSKAMQKEIEELQKQDTVIEEDKEL